MFRGIRIETTSRIAPLAFQIIVDLQRVGRLIYNQNYIYVIYEAIQFVPWANVTISDRDIFAFRSSCFVHQLHKLHDIPYANMEIVFLSQALAINYTHTNAHDTFTQRTTLWHHAFDSCSFERNQNSNVCHLQFVPHSAHPAYIVCMVFDRSLARINDRRTRARRCSPFISFYIYSPLLLLLLLPKIIAWHCHFLMMILLSLNAPSLLLFTKRAHTDTHKIQIEISIACKYCVLAPAFRRNQVENVTIEMLRVLFVWVNECGVCARTYANSIGWCLLCDYKMQIDV